MKKVLFVFFLFLMSCANAFSLDDSMPDFTMKDQFGKERTLHGDVKFVLFAADKATNGVVTDYLTARPKDFLEKNSACYVADISGMPSLIAKIFALPKMKKYSFSVLLATGEQAKAFDKKEHCVTVYTLQYDKVLNMQYVKTAEELDAIFE